MPKRSGPRGPDPPVTDVGVSDRSRTIGEVYEQNHVWMEDDAYLVVRDRDAAEGIVQRIFVKLLRGRVAVEKLTRKYLRRAVRNTCTDALAHERREGEVLALFAGEFGDGNDGTPLAMNETTERWARLLAILPPRPREILLALAQGLSHSEIAAYLGISVKTVETHWQRVKAIARRERERERERGGEERDDLAIARCES